MKFNINIIILPATRFVLLKLTTVAHSSFYFKSFFLLFTVVSVLLAHIHLTVSVMPSIVFQGLTLWFPTTFAKGQTWLLKSGEFHPR